jgi:hypothetical protein
MVDFAYASAAMGSVVAVALLFLINLASIFGIVIVGLFMIADPRYLTLFTPWLIYSVMYIAAVAALLGLRTLSGADRVVIVVQSPPVPLAMPPAAWPNGWRTWPNETLLPAPLPAAAPHVREAVGSRLLYSAAPRPADTIEPLWTRTASGLCTAEIGAFLAAMEEEGTHWSWTLSHGGVVLVSGTAPTFSQAGEAVVDAVRRFE